ncbi:MAG: radical SAM protein [Thermoplasmata archaeon]
MANVIFIEPASPGVNIYSKFKLPLLGPLYLGTILKKEGHDVAVLNENIRRIDFEELRADVLILTCLTSTAPRGYMIAEIFKRNNPESVTIMGGVHATFNIEEALKHVDYVAVGEGEEVIAESIKAILNKTFKGRLIIGKPVENLDSLPYPDFSLMGKMSNYILPIMGSRGCPFDCTFCTVTKMFGRKFRTRTLDNIIGELKSFTSRAQNVFFYDDNFTADKRRSKVLFQRMIDEGVKCDWFAQVRTDVAKDEELLKLMADSGCYTVFIGLESVNDETLRKMNKRQNLEDIRNSIRKLHDYNIHVHGMFIFGNDEDDRRTPKATVEFCRESDIDSVQYLILTPLPGSDTYKEMMNARRIFTKKWQLYDAHHVVYKPKNMNAYELQMAQVEAHNDFYSITRGIKRLFSRDLTFAGINFYARRINDVWLNANRSFLEFLEKKWESLKYGASGLMESISSISSLAEECMPQNSTTKSNYQ